MSYFAQLDIGLLLHSQAIALDTPGVTAIIAGEDQTIVTRRPAPPGIDEIDTGQHPGGGYPGLLPALAIVFGKQNMAIFTCRYQALSGGGNVQQQ